MTNRPQPDDLVNLISMLGRMGTIPGAVTTYPYSQNYKSDTQTAVNPGSYATVPMVASGQITPSNVKLTGFFVSSASNSPTIQIWNNKAASGNPLLATFVPSLGMTAIPSAQAINGLYVTIGGTVTVTFFYDPLT